MAFTFDTDVTLNAAKALQTNTIKIPTASGGTTYSTGTNGMVIKSNGTTVYWANDSNSDLKVKQTNTTGNANYSILLSYSENTTSEKTEQARKNSTVYVNTFTGQIFSQSKPVIIGEYGSEPSSPIAGQFWFKYAPMTISEAKPLVVQFTASSLPTTINNSNITADMEVIRSDIGNPDVQQTNLTVSTSAGSLTVSGTISGATPITLWLARCR